MLSHFHRYTKTAVCVVQHGLLIQCWDVFLWKTFSLSKLFKFLKTLVKDVIKFQPQGQLNLFEQGEKVFEVKHLGDEPKSGGKLITADGKQYKTCNRCNEYKKQYDKFKGIKNKNIN